MTLAAIIRTAIDSLVKGWPARIAAFNADAANTVDLEELPLVRGTPSGKAVYFGGTPEHAVYPAVEVQIGSASHSRFSIEQYDHDVLAPVVVQVWLEGSDGEVPALYEQALGYGQIVAEILTQPDAFGPSLTLEPEGEGYREDYFALPVAGTERENRSFERWRTSAVVTFNVEDLQARP